MYNKKNAFTLLELIISLSIMAIFAAMIIGDFRNQEIRELRNVSEKLISDIKYVQKVSMATNSNYKIILKTNEKYIIMKPNGINEYKEEDTVYLPKNIMMHFKEPIIEFTSAGTLARGSETISIYLDNHYSEVTISPSTGFSRIKILK